MSEQDGATGAENAAPKLKMVFRVDTWSIRSRISRSGREEGDSIVLSGKLFAPTIDPNTPLTKAGALVKPKEPQDRMTIKIGKDNSVLTLPLEEFGMDRVAAKLTELAGHYDLAVSIEFEAHETTDRQNIEHFDIAFTKPTRAAAKPAAGAAAQRVSQKDAYEDSAVQQAPPIRATR